MKCEILAPAGDEQTAYVALNAGADAVYMGLKQFSARAGASNLDAEALARVAQYAHILGAKVYVALNTLVKDGETEDFFLAARRTWEAGADAILLQDLFLGRELKRLCPEIVLHLSTQAGCCNLCGAEVAREYGFSRAVLARETPIADMGAISKVIETEVFVQGALCTAFSGQCYFSSFAGGNSGNRGRCKQPCRKRYAIDRKGYEAQAYALSTSDLCLGGRLGELLAAGVSSIKIEGRMRRPEYVGAAVRYYRALLDGSPAEAAFEELRRAYNRGDYTEGLGFGQSRGFLSRAVQGHIGEAIGRVEFRHGRPFCRTEVHIVNGDACKILRQGKEVGGAIVPMTDRDGAYLSSPMRLREGDEVRLTTSAVSNASALQGKRLREIVVSLRFVAGERARAACGDVVVEGEPLDAAERSPLTAEELAACFSKTDGLPFLPRIEAETEGAFLPKSALNALRRAFYAALVRHFSPVHEAFPKERPAAAIQAVKGERRAVISDMGYPDILIYKPKDYRKLEPCARGRETYLYLPPFFTAADEALLSGQFGSFDGIYCEGYYGIALARKYGLKLFAGTGFNLTNRYAVAGVREAATYFALSKELTLPEIGALAADGAFFLAGGDIKLMDLCYCPFERTCADCDRRDLYRMTDEAGRVFLLRRYRTSDMVCRFEVYNCAFLRETEGVPSALYDDSAKRARPKESTGGHFSRGIL